MALNNIHVESQAMTAAVSKAGDVQTSIMDFEKQLTNMSEMVKAVWGGRAKVAFDQKHQEISSYLGVNAQDAGSISEGTNTAHTVTVAADDDAYQLINAISGH